jgi:hypothetical protein
VTDLKTLLGVADDLTIRGVPSRFGPRDVSVIMMPSLPDGRMVWSGINFLWIGTRPLPLMEEVGRDARRTVRKGLQDVLEWLGEDWNNEPSGAEIYQRLKDGENPMEVTNKHVGAH